ncbi:MAG TPA: ribose-5-phosphate isomerase RpiA [Candidatus Binataceae bacterium]|nr:ribose-5-phosphate isomerase RpiA [Candidatus Binataceae bacterium]
MGHDAHDQMAALAKFALAQVRPHHTIGLGTGRAASAFINALGHSLIAVRGVPTSRASEELARALGIEIVSLVAAPKIDLDFDGADEVDPRLNLIKGNGGALVREKIVAAASRKVIILVGEEKLVRKLGARGRLPVEVVPFAVPLAARKVAALGLKPALRRIDGVDFVTDNGNLILDCAVKEIHNPARLDRDLLSIPGVVGTGIFAAMAQMVIVAMKSGEIKTLRPR